MQYGYWNNKLEKKIKVILVPIKTLFLKWLMYQTPWFCSKTGHFFMSRHFSRKICIRFYVLYTWSQRYLHETTLYFFVNPKLITDWIRNSATIFNHYHKNIFRLFWLSFMISVVCVTLHYKMTASNSEF